MNQYLRSPAAYRQFRSDSCIIKPSPSYIKKIKGDQKITDGFCVEMLIPQEMHKSTGTTEWGQVGFDKIKIASGIVTNVKNDVMSGMSEDAYDLKRS